MGYRFSVGDRVRVVGITTGASSNNYNRRDMPEYDGLIATITRVRDHYYSDFPYVLDVDHGAFVWSEDWLEPYEDDDLSAMESASESDILSFLCGGDTVGS